MLMNVIEEFWSKKEEDNAFKSVEGALDHTVHSFPMLDEVNSTIITKPSEKY